MRTVIIGEAMTEPWLSSGVGKSGRVASPLDGPSGQRIADLIGVSLTEFLDAYDRVNAYDGLCLMWDHEVAAIMLAGKLGEIARRGEESERLRWICLGHRMGEAVIGHHEFFEWHTTQLGSYLARIVTVPHPSGLSRWWNDSSNLERARLWWREEWRWRER